MWLVGDILLRVLRGGGSAILGLAQVVNIFTILVEDYLYSYIYYCQGVMELLERARVTLVRMRPMEGPEAELGSWAVRIYYILYYIIFCLDLYLNI